MQENICSGRLGTAANYCWHTTGKVLLCYPEKIEQQCCFCGAIKYLTLCRCIGNGKNHGKFYPKLSKPILE